MIRRFNRFELKFLVDDAIREALTVDLRQQMSVDPHGRDGGYPVTSLYYDSPDLSCYWAKVEGIKFRRKVRVRCYAAHSEQDDDPVMVEIKQRINRTVQKRRVVMPLAGAVELLAGGDPPTVDDPVDRQVISELAFLTDSLRLQPTCVIAYRRHAFVGSDYEPGLRITFDAGLSCRGPERDLGEGMPGHRFLAPGFSILEVKVDEAVPLWVTRMLARHQCSLRRYSKYCAGLARLRNLRTHSPYPLSHHQGARDG